MFGTDALTGLQAPLGMSYRCWAPKQLPLQPLGGASIAARKDNATLLVNNFQLQPFIDDLKVFGDGQYPSASIYG